MHIAITGSSGLIGSALTVSLRGDGHTVVPIVRRPAATMHEVTWDPRSGSIDIAALQGVDAVVNLAGAGLGDRRWNRAYKEEILRSRTAATTLIARACVDAGVPVLVSGSAIGWYGDTGSHAVDENSPQGGGFLADVVAAWEQAADVAVAAGVRVTWIRTGLVASAEGGAFARMLPLFRLGLGGPLGSGAQYWSAISMRDEVRAIRFLIERDLHGPFNLTAPTPVTNAAFTRALARAVRRPALLPVPGFALRLVLGEFAGDILGSQRVLPTRLLDAGFEFADPTVEDITAALVH